MKQVIDPSVRWLSDSWARNGDVSGEIPVGVLRLPFDYAVSYRPGARFGPDAIVRELGALSSYCTDKRVSLEEIMLVDCGTVDPNHDFEEAYRAVREAVVAMPAGLHPVFLGGDHSLTDPIFRGICKRHRDAPLGLVVIDAHFDMRPPIPGHEHSGNWLHTLGDVLDYGKVAQLGIGAPIYSAEYMRSAEERGILVRTPFDIRQQGWGAALREVVEHVSAGTAGVYVSTDIDSIFGAFAPGTSCPNPAGLLPHEAMDAMFILSRDLDTVGMDVVEVSPPLDSGEATSQLAAHIVLNHLAGLVAGHGS